MNKQERAPAPGAGAAASLHGPAPGRSTQVQRLAAPTAGPAGPAPGHSTQVQDLVRRAAGARGAGGAGAAGAVDAVARSSGAPLPAGPRARFEASLGADLGDVRVHDGAASHAAATQLGAQAFTVGRDIHFGAGRLQPDRPAGMHLLAHEVAHTVQQGGGATGVQTRREGSPSGDASEVEADRFADHVVHGGAMPKLSLAPSSIQRQDDPEADAYDAQVTAIVVDLLEDYQNIPLVVPVGPPARRIVDGDYLDATTGPVTPKDTIFVDIPYWNAGYLDQGEDTPEAYNNANTGSGRNDRHVRYDTFHGAPEAPTVGSAKGSPEQIKAFVQNAITSNLIPSPGLPAGADATQWKEAWKAAIEPWMLEAGIGVDCNGLVYHALMRVQRDAGAVTTGQAGENPSVFDEGSHSSTNVSVRELGETGVDVDVLALRPGDIMYLAPPEGQETGGHVRIVTCAEVTDGDNEVIVFSTAESTVSGRSSDGDTDNGPRAHHWRWRGKGEEAEKGLFERYEGSAAEEPDRVQTSKPIFRRHFLPPSEQPEGGS